MPARSGWKPGLTHIGTQKQLFLDDHRVESLKNAAFVLNPAKKYRDNPVYRRENPWEGNAIHYGAVLYDEQDQLFRMWVHNCHFTGTERVPKKAVASVPGITGQRWLYAVSADGYHWEKPDLGLVEFEGSTSTRMRVATRWYGTVWTHRVHRQPMGFISTN